MGDRDVDRLRDDPPAVVVYWRPGCWFCNRLFGGLDRAGIETERRNIWEDDEARRFVRDHNGGNETVPTVAIGDQVFTNPPARTVIEMVLGPSSAEAGDAPPGLIRRLLGS
jgi:mycoredoxin